MFGKDVNDINYGFRKELVFLLLAGIFLGSLAMLNILGVSRFIDLSTYIGIPDSSDFRFAVAVGVLPYPITFLCTDLISEIYGRRRANMVVWVGFVLNIWVVFILWFGGWLNPPDYILDGDNVASFNGQIPADYAFYKIRTLTFGATFASMIAYLTAQFVDVQIFHLIKKKTQGKKLWLRNNMSTLVSQLVDSVAVILITHFYANALPIEEGTSVIYALFTFIISSYLFKFAFALIDTIPMYVCVHFLRKYLNLEENQEVD